jgi:outer membrane protein
MRVFAVALALGAMLMAAPTYAQAPAPAPPAPQAAAPAPPARVPFQEGLRYAYVNEQEVVATSAEGKALNAKVVALNDQKVKELNERNAALQAAQQKLESDGGVLNEQALRQLQADIDKQTRDLQRFTEDAQQEVTALTQQLQVEFYQKLTPVIDKVAKEKKLHFVFSAQESGLVWADASLDLTPDIVRALDAATAATEP